jgi:hypothetical protein
VEIGNRDGALPDPFEAVLVAVEEPTAGDALQVHHGLSGAPEPYMCMLTSIVWSLR